jgi:hypothetical protein
MGYEMADARAWQDHYVEHGFCILRRIIDQLACDAAIREVRRLVNDGRPLSEWNSLCPGERHSVYYYGQARAIDELIDHPALASILRTFFGDRGFHFGPTDSANPDRRRFAVWVNPYDAEARQRLLPMGHIDSGSPYRGAAIQIALSPTRAFSGNTTFFPDSHREMMRWIEEHTEAFDGSWPGGVYAHLRRPLPPWEFVAEPGDLVLSHHLLFHSGNPSHADDRSPRICIRAEVFPEHPLDETSTIAAEGTAFERSLALYHRSKK